MIIIETLYSNTLNLGYAHPPLAYVVVLHRIIVRPQSHVIQGQIQGGGLWGQKLPPPPSFFGGLQRDGKMSHACAQMESVLVFNRYTEAPFLKSCIHPCHSLPMYSFPVISLSLSLFEKILSLLHHRNILTNTS